jgi:hypothetical protein
MACTVMKGDHLHPRDLQSHGKAMHSWQTPLQSSLDPPNTSALWHGIVPDSSFTACSGQHLVSAMQVRPDVWRHRLRAIKSVLIHTL